MLLGHGAAYGLKKQQQKTTHKNTKKQLCGLWVPFGLRAVVNQHRGGWCRVGCQSGEWSPRSSPVLAQATLPALKACPPPALKASHGVSSALSPCPQAPAESSEINVRGAWNPRRSLGNILSLDGPGKTLAPGGGREI